MGTLRHEIARELASAVDKTFHLNESDLYHLCINNLREPPDPEWGDFASSIALSLAKRVGEAPLKVAERIHAALMQKQDIFQKVEVAGNGHLNITLANPYIVAALNRALVSGGQFEIPKATHPHSYNLEFVSANPTGPLHIGHARWAVIGDTLARILRATGHRVETEYYVNDVGQQIELLGQSAEAILQGRSIPEGGYGGAYLTQIVQGFAKPSRNDLGREIMEKILADQKKTLATLRVHFDRFFFEHELHEKGRVQDIVQKLEEKGHAYWEGNSLLFCSTHFGDEKDRVLVRSAGGPTYFAADLAYHAVKFSRGYDDLINVWGADHHGYVKRLQGGLKAIGLPAEKQKIIIGQLVSLSRGGEAVRMSKRTGDIVTVDEVMDEVGVDAVRFFLLQTRPESHVNFDLELAKKQSAENPVYYIQYAHARCVSIGQEAAARQLLATLPHIPAPWQPESILERLLIVQLLTLPDGVVDTAERLEPHRLAHTLLQIAKNFHNWYHQHRVLIPDASSRSARLHLVTLIRQRLARVLELLGISAPDHM